MASRSVYDIWFAWFMYGLVGIPGFMAGWVG